LVSELAVNLLWAEQLQSVPSSSNEAFRVHLPAIADGDAWLRFATACRTAVLELRRHGQTPEDAIDASEELHEKQLWTLLAKVDRQARQRLEGFGFVVPSDLRPSDLHPTNSNPLPEIWFVGLSDLPLPLTTALAGWPASITALIAAPSNMANYFDPWGCVSPTAWADRHLPITREHLIVADDPPSQALAATATIASWSATRAPAEIVVGAADESIVPLIARELDRCEVAHRSELGTQISRFGPGRLLRLIIDYLTRCDFEALAAVVRQADVASWLDEQLGTQPEARPWLETLDRVRDEHLPKDWQEGLAEEVRTKYPLISSLLMALDKLFSPLGAAPRPLSEWSTPLRQVLADLYRDRLSKLSPQAETRVRAALAGIDRRLQVFERLTALHNQSVSAADAIGWLLTELEQTRVPDPEQRAAVEIVGWLDLILEDAPAIVLVGLNEPYLPAAQSSAPLLPAAIRARYQQTDAARRYARDAFGLEQLVRMRAQFRAVVGRRDLDGTATPPSRLLAACPAIEAAKRIVYLIESDLIPIQVRQRRAPQRIHSHFPIPALPQLLREPLNELSVTGFKEYLSCPYRFFLRRVMRLNPLADCSREMQANQFGSLIHDAWEQLGRHPQLRSSTSSRDISEYLLDQLQTIAHRRFGPRPRPAVRIQIDQARQLLIHASEVQARRASEGWQIATCEIAVPRRSALLEVDGQPFYLSGRLDRVDYHPEEDRWAVLDYKTHDRKPDQEHFNSKTGRWLDLQLPLYRHMIAHAVPEYRAGAPIELGYFNLGRSPKEIDINLLTFDESMLQDAESTARDVVRRLRQFDFALADTPPKYDDFQDICQSDVFDVLSSIGGESE